MTAQQTRVIENRTYLEKSMRELLPHGYKCYTVKPDPTFGDISNPYGYLITPNGNILYVQNEYYGGWSFTFEYVPTHENGSGCQCISEAESKKVVMLVDKDDISLETVQRAEAEGSRFAAQLKATRYSSPEAWMKSYRRKEDLIPIEPVEQEEAVC